MSKQVDKTGRMRCLGSHTLLILEFGLFRQPGFGQPRRNLAANQGKRGFMDSLKAPRKPSFDPSIWTVFVILGLLGLLVGVPRIGSATLWDQDEGLHVTCTKEMMDANNWVVPTFNYKLMGDKPALMFWLQRIAFEVGGVNEAMARMPGVICSILSVWATAVIGWSMAKPGQKGLMALLSGTILTSTIALVCAARFANPDAILNACLTPAIAIIWLCQAKRSSAWLWMSAFFTGMGVLAKGPIGLAIPAGITFFFLLWQRRLREAFRFSQIMWGTLIFAAVTLPWYAYVGVETKGEWLEIFFFKHNLGRFSSALEGHTGPFWYYLPILLIAYAPWSIFLTPLVWTGILLARTPQTEDGDIIPSDREKVRFLGIWIVLVLGFFSVASTKLPNYIFPCYPALSILLAWYFLRKIEGTDALPGWVWPTCWGCLVLVGGITFFGFLIGAGTIPISAGDKMRTFPGLELWAWIGLIPLAGLVVMWWLRGQTGKQVAALCFLAVAFSGSIGLWNLSTLNDVKAQKPLVGFLPPDLSKREVQLATLGWFQPSIVFYAGREVRNHAQDRFEELESMLVLPRETYLFTTASQAAKLRARGWELTELGRHYDFYRNIEALAIKVEGRAKLN